MTKLYSYRIINPENTSPTNWKYALAIQFKTATARDGWLNIMFTKLQTELNLNPKTICDDIFWREDSSLYYTAYIQPSKGPGSIGTYVAQRGELAITLGNAAVVEKFCTSLNLDIGNGTGLVDKYLIHNNAIYFMPEALSLDGATQYEIPTQDVAASGNSALVSSEDSQYL